MPPVHYNYERLNAVLLCEAITKLSPIQHLNMFDWCSIDGWAMSKDLKQQEADSCCSLRYAIATDSDRDTIYLVVSNDFDVESMTQLQLRTPQGFQVSSRDGTPAGVHSGCLGYAEGLPLVELLGEHGDAGKRIIVCGFGWGGTLASIATCILRQQAMSAWKDRIVGYTFGAPQGFASPGLVETTAVTSGDSSALEHFVHPQDIVHGFSLCPDSLQNRAPMKKVRCLCRIFYTRCFRTNLGKGFHR